MVSKEKIDLNQQNHLLLYENLENEGSFKDSIPLSAMGESERFRLLVSRATPSSHEVIIFSKLKKIDQKFSVLFANPILHQKGWSFGSGHDLDFLEDVYRGAKPHFTGIPTLPLLWDNREERIINNSSDRICEILDAYIDPTSNKNVTLYPNEYLNEIHEFKEQLHFNLDLAFLRAGSNHRQILYEKHVQIVFETLDDLEIKLSKKRFLLGDRITGVDVKLFVTLIRFELVYNCLFHCNLKRLKDYPNLYNYMKCIYQIEEISSTCNFTEIKEHYFKSPIYKNSHLVIPVGPLIELDSAHDRGAVQYFEI